MTQNETCQDSHCEYNHDNSLGNYAAVHIYRASVLKTQSSAS